MVVKETEKKREVRLLALDVDGTLFDSNGHVTEKTIQALKRAREKGVQVVLASGRGYDWMPWNQLTEVAMDYVITTNGGGVYRCGDGMCLHEETMDGKELLPLFQFLQEKEVYITVFMDGATYTPRQCFSYVENMDVPEYVAQSLKDWKKELKDLEAYIRTHEAKIQKVTLNFQKAPDGGYLNREEVKEYLEARTDIHAVDGGFANLEFTKAGVSKATGIRFLSEMLQIPMEQTMAAGDSENDIEMICEAGIGIAMGNALEQVKQAADDITATNDEAGVASAIEKYILI